MRSKLGFPSHLLGSLVLVLGSLIFGFLGVEILLRVISPPFFDTRSFDPVLGWKHTPGGPDYWGVGEAGSRIRREVNDLGFLDVQHDCNAEVNRIAVIGDSFTAAAQVELRQTYWKQLEQRLDDSSHRPWEVQGFGMGDFGTLQEWLTLELYAAPCRPLIVILQIFPMNDIFNNSPAAAYITSTQDSYRPYLDPASDFGSITNLNPKTSWLRRHSYIFRNLFLFMNLRGHVWGDEKFHADQEQRLQAVRALIDFHGMRSISHPETSLVEQEAPIYFLLNTFAPPEFQLDMVREGWSATEAALSRIVDTTNRIDAELLVLIVPNAPHYQDIPVRHWKERVSFPFGPYYAEHRIQNLLAPEGVPVVALIDEFKRSQSTVIPPLRGHFNVATHALVADALSVEIKKLRPSDF